METNYTIKEKPVLKFNSCPKCGLEVTCSGMGNDGAEWSCFNPGCISWPKFSYKKRKEGYSKAEISKLWKKHKEVGV